MDKLWWINMTSVGLEYTRKGINNQMTTRVIQEATNRGFKLISSLSDSAFTQRNKIYRHNFQVVCELDFQRNYLNYEIMSEETKSTHTKCCVLAKTL